MQTVCRRGDILFFVFKCYLLRLGYVASRLQFDYLVGLIDDALLARIAFITVQCCYVNDMLFTVFVLGYVSCKKNFVNWACSFPP